MLTERRKILYDLCLVLSILPLSHEGKKYEKVNPILVVGYLNLLPFRTLVVLEESGFIYIILILKA
jgi:hypothetical protein